MCQGRLETNHFEGTDCVSVVLNCALEGFLGVVGGMMVCATLVCGCTIYHRGGRVYFA